MKACSAACRTWRDALKPFANLKDLCYRALRFPSGSKVKLPSIPEAVEAVLPSAAAWRNNLSWARLNQAGGTAWPALVSEISISSELVDGQDDFMQGPVSTLLNTHAPVFLQVAREILCHMPLAWRTKPMTMSTHSTGERVFATCELMESEAQ